MTNSPQQQTQATEPQADQNAFWNIHNIMDNESVSPSTEQIVQAYFSNQEQSLSLTSGETLLSEGEINHRVYYVQKGELKGFWKDKDGAEIESFRARHGSFIGIPSFFSKMNISLHTVVTATDAELFYIDQHQKAVEINDTHSIEKQFMPIVINELIHRQLHVQKLAFSHAQTQKILAHQEKMAALGKISAGIAHELNNAIAVIQHSTNWLTQMISNGFSESGHTSIFFNKGFDHGRVQSSREIRSRTHELKKQYKIDSATASQLAQLDVSKELEKEWLSNTESIQTNYRQWEAGATLKDMKTASTHAASVVKSVKALGSKSSLRETDVDINDTLQEAFLLLRIPLRNINLIHSLHSLEPAYVNWSELIQVWVNLIQNSIDSLESSKTENPTLTIKSTMVNHSIQITFSDNGPGIPPSILHKIFDPQFTTKSGEASVGLGLGLTFVDRIISAHDGTVHVESKPGSTVFRVTLPPRRKK